MRRVWKIMITVSGFLAVLGILFTILGAAFGGTKELGDLLKEEKDAQAETSTYQTLAKVGEIKNIQISAGACVLYIRENTDDAFVVEGSNRAGVTCKVKDGCLLIENAPEKTISNWIGGKNEAAVMTLFVPRLAKLAEVSVDFEAGSLDIGNLDAQRLNVKIAAGDMEATGLDVNNLTINAEAAQVKASLNGKETDYNYGINTDLAKMQIGTMELSGLDTIGNFSFDNHGSRTANLNCKFGQFDISFEE